MGIIEEKLRQLNGPNVQVPWKVDDTYPFDQVPQSEFYDLPEFVKTVPAPFNFFDYIANQANNWWEQESATNPIWGERRRDIVGKYYDTNNSFRQGNDDVANTIMSIVLTTATGLGLGSVAKTLMTQGVKALPGVLAAIAGAKGGQEALDAVTQEMTGRTWTEHLDDAGLSDYNQALFQPGAWGGSYAASKAVNGLIMNGPQWVANQIPRTTITPKGPIEVQPGEVVDVVTGRPISFSQTPQGVSVYKGNWTTKTGAQGSSSGQPNRVQVSNSIPGGVQRRVMLDINGVPGNNVTTYNYYNPYASMSGVPGYMLPWFTTVPLETPPFTPPEYNFRYEEYTPYDDPFLNWFGEQKGTDTENTIQYWNGENSSWPAGPYWISWSTNGDPKSERRRVGDQQGYVIPDSSSYKRTETPRDEVNVLYPGVPDNAKRSNEKIRGK